MGNFDLDNLQRKNIFKIPENTFDEVQKKVLNEINRFDVDKLERKNIFKTSENMFENIQQNVMREIDGFNVENVERKNIYHLPEDTFKTIQENVLKEIKPKKKAPVFSLNWGYAMAASLALIVGITFLYNSDSIKNSNSEKAYVDNKETQKKESELAYETLASDLTLVENNNQNDDDKVEEKTIAPQVASRVEANNKNKSKVNIEDIQMNEYLESLSNSEIAELANNSNQDIYLDLYN